MLVFETNVGDVIKIEKVNYTYSDGYDSVTLMYVVIDKFSSIDVNADESQTIRIIINSKLFYKIRLKVGAKGFIQPYLKTSMRNTKLDNILPDE